MHDRPTTDSRIVMLDWAEGSTGSALQGDRWHLTASGALADLDASWANWWSGLTSRSAEQWRNLRRARLTTG